MQLPSVDASRWRLRTWVLEGLAGVLAFFLTLFAGVRLVRDPHASGWELLGTFGIPVGLLIVAVVRAGRTRKDEMRFDPLAEPKDLVGWTKGLHENLCQMKGCDADALGVRITIHAVDWNARRTRPETTRQVTNYHGGRGGPLGRIKSVRTGIIGRVARLAEPYDAKREAADAAAFRDELVGVWGFTADEANEVATDRWAWFALPLLQPEDETPYGVVYLDAREIGFFDDEGIRNAVVQACSILASLCVATYTKK